MMNREQAEHILDAYINLENSDGDNKARQSLREVILDAMSYKEAQDYVERLESENAMLCELVLALSDCRNTTCDDCIRWNYPEGGCVLDIVMHELGIEATPKERMMTNEVPQETSDH